jgi:hypothetical protein
VNYLGAVIERNGGSKADVISTDTKVKMFNCTIKSVLLYGAETWIVDKNSWQKLQTFINKSLRKILKTHWLDKISNIELWNITKQEPIETTVKWRKWNWIGHMLKKANDNIVRQALEHLLVGKRKRGKPLNSWWRSITREHEAISLSWTEIKRMTKNREEWKETVTKICKG